MVTNSVKSGESVLGAIMRVFGEVQAVVDKILTLAEEPHAQSA